MKAETMEKLLEALTAKVTVTMTDLLMATMMVNMAESLASWRVCLTADQKGLKKA